MKPAYAMVELETLDWSDGRFAVRRFAPDQGLEASLRRSGVLSPPWVWSREDGRRTIVDGFRRLRWLRESGGQRLECLVWPPEADEASLMLRRLEVKLVDSALNPAQKAQVVSKLASVLSRERVAAEYLPVLRIPPKQELLEQWCRLASLDEALLEAMAWETVCERAALKLADWDEASRREAAAMLESLRCSASIQMELLEGIEEIAGRDGLEPSDVLADPEIREIVCHREWNRRSKTRGLRERLYRMRYPRLSRREEQFERELTRAGLPASVRLVPPRFFEGEEWQVHLSFRNGRELWDLAGVVEDLARSEGLKRLLRPSGNVP